MAERHQWWRRIPPMEPMLPHPRAKVSERDLTQAKRQAIEAMQEFGVLVEASRASGIGRWQLEYLVRQDESADLDFAKDMRRARRECQERLEGAFIQRGMEKGGDLAGIFYQKHNWKKYHEGPQRIELTGKDGSPLNALDGAKAEILTRLAKLTERRGLEHKTEVVVGSAGSGPKLLPEGPRVRKVKS